MTTLTARQIEWLQSEIPSTVTVPQMQERYDHLGSVRDVAIEFLRIQRKAWLESPLSVNISGVASVTLSENVKAVERRLSALTGLDDDPSDETPGSGEGGLSELETYSLRRTRGR